MTAEETKEKLAAYAHAAWSGWMKYLFSKCYPIKMDNNSGPPCLVIPAWASERWKRQAATPYSAMPESEKKSDREEANKILEIIQPLITAAVAEERERCAKVAESMKGGYTASIDEDILVPDKDGPWTLNSDIAAAIRKGVKP